MGLSRLGWTLGAWAPPRHLDHGPLMVSGFLGTLIALERAVAFGRPAAYLAPALAALGAVLLFVWPPRAPAASLAGSLVLVLLFAIRFRQFPSWPLGLLALGAALWAAGNFLWMRGRTFPEVVPFWAAFLAVTIAAERFELAHFIVSRGARRILLGLLGLLLAGLAFDARAVGLSLLGIALWLLRYDIARRTARGEDGLARYIGRTLLGGYAWLGVSGLLWTVLAREMVAGPLYDAPLHAFFLGFVFSMIFAHSPVVAEAVLGVRVPYHRVLYWGPILLSATLAARIAGDLARNFEVRHYSAMANALALLAFPHLVAIARRKGRGRA